MKTKAKKSQRGDSAGRPSRPLNAYNIFFAIERRKIVAKQQKEAGMDGYTCPSSQRKHGQAHVGFANLARIVSERWKSIDEGYKAELEEKARLDKIRYDNEMNQWISKKQQNKEGFGDLTPTVPAINTVPTTASNTQNDGNSISLRSSKTIFSNTNESTSFLTNCEERHVSSGSLPFHLHCAPCFITVSTRRPENELSVCPRFPDGQQTIYTSTYEFDTAATSRKPSRNLSSVQTNPPPCDKYEMHENNPNSNVSSPRSSSNSADVGCFDFEPLLYQNFRAPCSAPVQTQANLATRSLPPCQHDLFATSFRNPITLGSYGDLGHFTPLNLHRAQNETVRWSMKSDTTASIVIPSDDGHNLCDAPTTQAPAFGYTCEFDDVSTSRNSSGNLRLPAKPHTDLDEKNGRSAAVDLQAPLSCDSYFGNFDLEPLPFQHFCAPCSAPIQVKATNHSQRLPGSKQHHLESTLCRYQNYYPSYANIGNCSPCDLPPAQDETKTVGWSIKSNTAAAGFPISSSDEYHLCDVNCDTQAAATNCSDSNMPRDSYRCASASTDGFPTIQYQDDKHMLSPAHLQTLEFCRNNIPGSVEMQSFGSRNSWPF